MLRASFLSVFFILIVFSCRGQMSASEWKKAIHSNAISKPASGGAYLKAPAGPALYFLPAGTINVPYIVYVPKGYDPSRPATMVVFLHGAILARETFQHEEPSIAGEPIFNIVDALNTIVVFPFARNDFAWGRNEEANKHIIKVIQSVQQTYNVDKRRVYIGGMSMGGNATYWFVNNQPAMFAGFYAFSSSPDEGVNFKVIAANKPLYTNNAKDDQTFAESGIGALYKAHKSEAPGWHHMTAESGGHRFIYSANGRHYVKDMLSQLLAAH